jgi:hypothetical protein
MRRVSPLGAIVRGLVAGAIGATAQARFARVTSRLARLLPERAQRRRTGELAHLGYGAAWGALYGLAREILPWPDEALTAIVATGAWLLSDDLLLPLLRAAPWPHRRAPRAHLVGLASHFAFGLSVAATYRALRRSPLALLGAALSTLDARQRQAALDRLASPFERAGSTAARTLH